MSPSQSQTAYKDAAMVQHPRASVGDRCVPMPPVAEEMRGGEGCMHAHCAYARGHSCVCVHICAEDNPPPGPCPHPPTGHWVHSRNTTGGPGAPFYANVNTAPAPASAVALPPRVHMPQLTVAHFPSQATGGKGGLLVVQLPIKGAKPVSPRERHRRLSQAVGDPGYTRGGVARGPFPDITRPLHRSPALAAVPAPCLRATVPSCFAEGVRGGGAPDVSQTDSDDALVVFGCMFC